MSGAPVRIERDGPLAVLVIDQPPLNLADDPLLEALDACIAELEADPSRGVLVRAEGKIVTGGVDVKVFAGLTSEEAVREWFGTMVRMAQRFEALPVPTVFAAHQLCLTWAFELSLCADILLAAESARFGLVEVVVGLTPGMGGTQRLAERAGPARAREFVLTGDLYDAKTMAEWGVVNRVLPDDGFAQAAYDLAMRLANGPTVAHAATKRIVRAQQEGGALAADALIEEVEATLFASEDHQNAVQSFLTEGPGKATYTGR